MCFGSGRKGFRLENKKNELEKEAIEIVLINPESRKEIETFETLKKVMNFLKNNWNLLKHLTSTTSI